jgi:hypothetical protein
MGDFSSKKMWIETTKTMILLSADSGKYGASRVTQLEMGLLIS